jgi:hypothetical protein
MDIHKMLIILGVWDDKILTMGRAWMLASCGPSTKTIFLLSMTLEHIKSDIKYRDGIEFSHGSSLTSQLTVFEL